MYKHEGFSKQSFSAHMWPGLPIQHLMMYRPRENRNKPFVCKHGNCDRSYYYKHHLQRHQIAAHGLVVANRQVATNRQDAANHQVTATRQDVTSPRFNEDAADLQFTENRLIASSSHVAPDHQIEGHATCSDDWPLPAARATWKVTTGLRRKWSNPL